MHVELLETRRLLATFGTAQIVGDTLAVVGTAGSDRIEFERRGDALSIHFALDDLVIAAVFPAPVTSSTQDFTAAELAGVTKIDVRTGGGDDTVILGKRIDLPARIDAGPGDDLIGGGNGTDVLLGGAGDDTLDGNYGTDTLYGGDGDDVLYTGATETTSDRLGILTIRPDVVWGGAGGDRAAVAGSVVIASGVEQVDVFRDAVRYTSPDDDAFVSPDLQPQFVAPRVTRPGGLLPGVTSAVGELIRTDAGGGGRLPTYAFEWRVTGAADQIADLALSPTDLDGSRFAYHYLDPARGEDAGQTTLVARAALASNFATGGGLAPTLDVNGGIYADGPPRVVGDLPRFDA